jgi:hypothetical protein
MADTVIPTGLTAFLDAMHAGDIDGVAAHTADNVTLKSPIVVEPFEGREQVMGVLSYLLDVADDFTVLEIMPGNGHFAVLVTITVGDTVVEGVDIMGVNSQGKVDAMSIQWRPLPAIVAVQNRLAPAIGIPVLTLTAAS